MGSIKKFDIAIIGGGMVGTSLALLLARANPNWKIALLEAQSHSELTDTDYRVSFDARSTAIAQGSTEILRELGVWEKLAQHATPISKVHVSDAGHFAGGLIEASTYQLDAVGYVVPNTWIGRVLFTQIQAHKNIQCFSSVQGERLTSLQSGVSLAVRSLSIESENERSGDSLIEIHGDLAIVADGGDSPLRKTLGIDSTLKDYNQTAVIANVAYTQPHNGVAYERFTPQGPLALLPLGEAASARESALVLTLPRDKAIEVSLLSDSDFLEHLQQRFGFRLGKFERVSRRHSYELKLILANEQIRSHVVLMGNAAHFLHPVAGQGFNLSLRDCACLADTLKKGVATGKPLGDLSLLQLYLQRQKLDQSFTIEFSDKLVRLFSASSLPLSVLRSLGFIGLDLMPALKNKFAAQTMGTAGERV
jgi:2-polyprenylphenol 6-hydroxylase